MPTKHTSEHAQHIFACPQGSCGYNYPLYTGKGSFLHILQHCATSIVIDSSGRLHCNWRVLKTSGSSYILCLQRRWQSFKIQLLKLLYYRAIILLHFTPFQYTLLHYFIVYISLGFFKSSFKNRSAPQQRGFKTRAKMKGGSPYALEKRKRKRTKKCASR